MRKKLLSLILLLFAGITAAQTQELVSHTLSNGQTLYFETTGEYTNFGNELVIFVGYSQPVGYESVSHSLVIPSTFIEGSSGYNVKYIGADAFNDWSMPQWNAPAHLTSLTIPYTVEYISDSAFRQYGCPMLTTLNYNPIRANIIRDGSTDYRSPFVYCSNLTTLNLGNQVEYIGDNMFRGLQSITSVALPNSISYIGKNAFRRCYALTTLTIPSSVKCIGPAAFSYCTGLTTVNFSADSCLDYHSLSLSDNADFTPWFDGCSNITSLNIDSNVTFIPKCSFGNMTSLTTLTIPRAVRQIGKHAFSNCIGLTTLNFNADSVVFGLSHWMDTLAYEIGSYWNEGQWEMNVFENDTNITILNIGNNVTVIPQNAFKNLSGLTSLTIPSSVRTIGGQAFANCTGLTTLNFNADSIYRLEGSWDYDTIWHSMYTNVFQNDTNIATLSIGSNVTVIPQNAFKNLSGLTSLNIPSSVANIGAYAFDGCRSLQSLTIPGSVRTIGTQAFANCTGLTTLNFNADSVGQQLYSSGSETWYRYNMNNVFLNDTTITTLNIGSNVTIIPQNAFKNLSGLTSLNIPSSVTNIGAYAFDGCRSLQSLTIPSSVRTIEGQAFANCTSLSTLNFNADSIYRLEDWWDTVWHSMYTNVFQNDTNIATLNIGNNVTVIPDNAFSWLVNLTTLNMPNSVTHIGARAFSDCSRLTSLNLPASLSYIGQEAFQHCSSLTELTIPESVRSIGNRAFCDCTGLTTLNFFADSLYTRDNWSGDTLMNAIPEYVFEHDTNIATLNIGNNVTVVPQNAFRNLTRLTNLTIPNTIKRIGASSFSGCRSLTSLIIPDSVSVIEYSAFDGCSGVTSVTIGKAVDSIQGEAFYGCSNLQHTYYQDSLANWCGIHFDEWGGSNPVQYSHNLYIGNTLLTDLTIPSTVTTIGSVQFSGCQSITSLTIPNSVTSIGYSSFANCTNIDTLILGNSISSIGSGAFYGCTGLDCIISQRNTAPSLGSDVFYGVDMEIPVHIPCGRMLSYMSRWNYFSDFIEASGATFTALSANTTQGTVSTLIQPTCTAPTAVVAAYANTGYRFDHWSDGNYTNPRSLSVSTDTVIIAYFTQDAGTSDTVYIHDTTVVHDTTIVNNYIHDTTYIDNYIHDTTIVHDTTVVNNYIHDTTYINNYIHDTTIVNNYIHDTAYVHDTTIVNNYIHDTTYIDNYIYDTVTVVVPIDYYTLTLASEQPTLGFVVGSGTFSDSTTVEIAAVAVQGNHFVQWSDGSTENPRHVLVREDMNLTASFAADEVGITDVQMSGATITVQGNIITVQGAAGERVRIFDVVGRLLSTDMSIAETRHFRMMAAGVYLVQVGDGTAQRVVVR